MSESKGLFEPMIYDGLCVDKKPDCVKYCGGKNVPNCTAVRGSRQATY